MSVDDDLCMAAADSAIHGAHPRGMGVRRRMRQDEQQGEEEEQEQRGEAEAGGKQLSTSGTPDTSEIQY